MVRQEPRVQRLVFGIDRVPEEVQSGGGKLSDPNPCVIAYGPGPEGVTCRNCTYLYAQGGVAGRYLKCEFRANTHGPASDHRAGWPTCAKFEPCA